ncbi:hypothetical protein [Thiohalocapsa sp.]|uniref:hypothetical protein n=1 Tax=Thiohalocapsa sp. TaxID=2497641 RepID=UPI0025F7E703|nr:hypothetical protein [Thiohalocapsa sp.]
MSATPISCARSCPCAGRVTRVPDADAIARVMERQPGTIVNVAVEPGQHLQELQGQDQYSVEMAQILIGARDQLELVDKYRDALGTLEFGIERDEPGAVSR